MEIDGPTLLQEAFHKFDVHSWGMFGTLIGYVIFFRFVQYFLFAFQTGSIKLFSSNSTTTTSSSKRAATGQSYQAVSVDDNKQSRSGLEIDSANHHSNL